MERCGCSVGLWVRLWILLAVAPKQALCFVRAFRHCGMLLCLFVRSLCFFGSRLMQWKILVFFLRKRGGDFRRTRERIWYSIILTVRGASVFFSLLSDDRYIRCIFMRKPFVWKRKAFLVSSGSCQKKYQCLGRPLSPYFFRHSCLFVSLSSRLEMRNGLEKTCFLLENTLKKLLKTSKMGKKTRKCPRFWFFCRVKDFPWNSLFFLCFRDLREIWLRVAGV